MKKLLFLFLLFMYGTNFAKSANWLEGKWKGTGYQIDGKTWSIEFSKETNTLNISYPSLGCSGNWKITKSKGNRAELEETITTGTDKCDQGCKIVVLKISAEEIAVVYYLPAYQKNSIANAVLLKQ
jgi:hypothetical protein